MNASVSVIIRLDPSRVRLHPKLAEPPLTAVAPALGRVFIEETSNGIPPEKYPVYTLTPYKWIPSRDVLSGLKKPAAPDCAVAVTAKDANIAKSASFMTVPP
jgi:hypothetical protein